jgi:hypothetical protein
VKRVAVTPVASDDDPSIARHYLLVLVLEALMLSGLAWLAAHYR